MDRLMVLESGEIGGYIIASIRKLSDKQQDFTIGKVYRLIDGMAHYTFYDHEVPQDFIGILTEHTYQDMNGENRHWIVGIKNGYWIPESKLELVGDI